MAFFKDMADRVASELLELEQWAKRKPEDTILRFSRPVQLDGYTCAVQATKAILDYYGFNYSCDRLAQLLGTTEDGTDFDDVVRVVRRLGLRCSTNDEARKRDLREAIDAGAPVLVSVDGDHASVVFGYGPDQVYLSDPSFARQASAVTSWEDFMERWDRTAVIVRGTVNRPGAGKREHEVRCPVARTAVSVPDHGTEWGCPECDAEILVQDGEAWHAFIVTCPVTGKLESLEFDGEGTYECSECGGDIESDGVRARHE